MDCIAILIPPWIYYFPFTIENSLFLTTCGSVKLWMTDIKKIMGKVFSCPFITRCKMFHCKSGMLSKLTQINKIWARHPPADWGSEKKRLSFSCTQCWITQYNLMYISSASVSQGGSPSFTALHRARTWFSCLSQPLTTQLTVHRLNGLLYEGWNSWIFWLMWTMRAVDLQMKFGFLQEDLIAGKGWPARARQRSAHGPCQAPTTMPRLKS